MKLSYAGLTIFSLVIALVSSMLLGQSKRPYDLIGIKFCPKSANETTEAQQELDKLYCQNEYKLLKEVWVQKQFEASRPLPESSLIIRDIPSAGNSAFWFLISPIASGVAYLCWAKKLEISEESAHYELEWYKTQIKLIGVNSRNERDFKAQTINSNWDKHRVAAKQISVSAMEDKLHRQQEVQDKVHSSALLEFDLANSEMNKKIAENLRDKNKADKESQKILGLKNEDNHILESNNKQLVTQLIKALKDWEDGWLWYLVESFTPIFHCAD